MERGAIDGGPARPFVGADELIDRAEAADGERRAEAPGLHAQPAEILQRIPEMGELPVEHGADAVGTDDQVAVTEVAVDDALGRTRRPVVAEPTESQLEGRMGLAQSVDDGPELFDRVPCGQTGNLEGRDPVDGGEDLAAAAASCRRARARPSSRRMRRGIVSLRRAA